MSSSQFFSTMEEYEELICLVENLKLEVTEYSKQINGPRGFAHSSDDEDDDDDGGDPKTTPATSQARGVTGDPVDRQTDRHRHRITTYIYIYIFSFTSMYFCTLLLI